MDADEFSLKSESQNSVDEEVMLYLFLFFFLRPIINNGVRYRFTGLHNTFYFKSEGVIVRSIS